MGYYGLKSSDYTWKNALLWGNFVDEKKQEEVKEEQTNETAKKIQSISCTLSRNNIVESWYDKIEIRLPCGGKHDKLVELETVLKGTAACIPTFFGFTNDQVHRLLSKQTFELWDKIKEVAKSKSSSNEEFRPLLLNLQDSVENDILTSKLPITKGQRRELDRLKGKILIVRSSSNEDSKVVNAGGNESVGGVEAEEEALKVALARVVKSYFSLQSFKNRSAFEDPFDVFPLCSVLVMQQVTENQDNPFPIVSGVMMTTKTAWCAPNEEGITHVSASWGFGSGTSNAMVCDEWVLTDNRNYPTVRRKLHRLVTSSFGVVKKEPNELSIKEIPCLSYKQLQQLRNIAKKLETHFKQAMDVEFVIKGEQLYLVQARPIQASNITKTTYLDPEKIPDFSKKFKGEMIVSGMNQVLSLDHSEIIFANNLEKAEKIYNPKHHKAVVVFTEESSTTHPAVNFASQHPPVPCIVLPYEKWIECKKLYMSYPFQICPQTGILVETISELPLQEGLFLHPARFPITIANGNSMQGESYNSKVRELKQLLEAVPEVLKNRLDEINNKLTQVFLELSERTAIVNNFADIAEKIKNACFDEVEEMKIAADSEKMTQLAFHAGVLRQLISQSGKQVIGAHSISGLEVFTQLPDYIEKFIHNHKSSQHLCKLALLGLNGFDEPIQRNWLNFLEQNNDEHQLKQLLEVIQDLHTLDLATHWFSVHFTSSSAPQINELLVQNETIDKNNSALFEFGHAFSALSDSIKNVDSIQELEDIWKTLQEKSNAFLSFCKQNELRHPLIMDLIDLWDLSTKAVRTSRLFDEREEAKVFNTRVKAFTEFAIQASESNVLNYSLIDLTKNMNSRGSDKHNFSVEHWLIPISHGALSSIKTDDQWLTVIHQNLLQAATYGDPEYLPLKLASAYNIFKKNNKCSAKRFSENGGTFVSIGKDRAFVRINIPLNYHSTVVTLSQKKGCDEIEVITDLRGYDNIRGMHLVFFQIFSKLSGISLKESEVVHPNLKVVFTLTNEEQATLLSRAINRVNSMSIHDVDNLKAMCFLLDPKNNNTKEIKEKITTCIWKEFKQSGICTNFCWNIDEMIWDLLETKNQLSEITIRVIEELEGKRQKSDFSKKFTEKVLRSLPTERSSEIVWLDLIGDQKISNDDIPEELANKLMPKLFKEMPMKVKQFPEYRKPKIFVELMSKKLDNDGLKSRDEADLLFHMALNCESEIPKQWVEALKAWKKEDIETFIKEKKEERSFLMFNEKKLETLLNAISFAEI